MAAAIVSSLSISAVLAVLAKVMVDAFGIGRTISVADFMVVSVVGAVLSSVVVLVLTVAVAGYCANRDLDLDNVAAPIVTAAGDMVTLPSLFLATYLLDIRIFTPIVAVVCVAIAVGAAAYGLRAKALPLMRRIVAESLPILVLADAVDVLAGRPSEALRLFLTYPALIVLVPPFRGLGFARPSCRR